jgi:hypothetical protein
VAAQGAARSQTLMFGVREISDSPRAFPFTAVPVVSGRPQIRPQTTSATWRRRCSLWKMRHAMFATHTRGLELGHAGHDPRIIGVIGLVHWAVSRGHRALCGLRGHEMVRHFEPARLSLRCVACGAETPGWTIDVRPAFRRGAPARAKVHRPAAGVQPGPRSSSSRSDPCLTLLCATTLKNPLILRIIRGAGA